jgi:hypothetical protein
MVTPYPETSTETDLAEDKIKFYLHATQAVRGSCIIRMLNEHEEQEFSKIIGQFVNTTLLAEVTEKDLNQFCISHTSHMLTINFILEILEDHLDIASQVTMSQNMVQKCLVDNISHKNTESLKFIVKDKHNIKHFKIPICSLRAIKSCYFCSICDQYETGNVNNTNGLIVYDNPNLFNWIFLFIMYGITPEPNDYELIKDMIIISHKYNVRELKYICEKYLVRYIDFDTVLNLMSIAFTSNATYLATYTIAFIKLHIKRYANAPELQNLPENISNKVIKLMKNIEVKTMQPHPSFSFTSHLYTTDLKMKMMVDPNHNFIISGK